MPRIADFSGGLNKRLDETRIPANQGVVFKNIDNSSGILKSAKDNKPLPDLNRSDVNAVAVENETFTFQPAAGTNPTYTSVIYNPNLLFGANKQYRIFNIYLDQAGRLIIQGDVNIADDENYQITLTTIEDNPMSVSVLTSNGRFNNPRDSSANQYIFTLTQGQREAFLNKRFGVVILPTSTTDNNPIGLDSNEILSVVDGKQFFREVGSSMIEYGDAVYFTRRNGKPLKRFKTTRNFNNVSTSINQPYAEENICVSSGQNQFQRIVPAGFTIFNSRPFNLASLFSYTAYTSRVCGNKYLRWRGKTIQTSDIRLSSSGQFDERSSAPAEESRITYMESVLDAEAIPAYTFKFLVGGKVVIGDRVEFDLSTAVSSSLVNYDTFPRITVLDYPTNFVPDINKSQEQNLNALRENITQTKLLVYTNDRKAHIISFTRDGTEAGVITLKYQPQTTSSFDITTTDTTNLSVLGGLNGIDRHIVYGVDSDDVLNDFTDTSPLYAKVQTVDMNLGINVRAIQVDRDSNQLWVMNIRRAGDPPLPTGSNTIFDLDYYTINKDTAAVVVQRTNAPINLPTFSPKLGYWARPNAHTIRTVVESQSLTEDRVNLSLTQNLGIEPPPRGPDDEPLRIFGFTAFNPQDLTFPSNIDVVPSSNYSTIRTGGGESTRGARAYERLVHEHTITLPVRVIIEDRSNDERKKVVKDYDVMVDDEAIIQTSKDECRQKGSIFSRRIECRRQTTTNVRQGITLGFGTYFSDNTNSHNLNVAIGIPDSNGDTQYRQLAETVSKASRSITTPNYITYANPTDLSLGADHAVSYNLDATGLTPYIADASERVSDSCRVQYSYTYYNANRDEESAPSKYTDVISVSRNDPVEIGGFVIPEDPKITDFRLYRACPDLGETAMTLIEQLPLAEPDGTPVIDITATDELTPADLGGLTYNDEGQLIFNQRTNRVDANGDPIITPIVIGNPDGTRHNPRDGFDEQWNRYLNANGRVLDTFSNLPPPPLNDNDENLLGHIKHLIVVKGTMIGIIGNRIHWSQTGFPDYWPAENFLSFNGEVTGIIEIANGLLVFTRNETHLISNFPDPANIDQTIISSEQGCVHIRTPKFIRGVPVWISNDGICTFIPGSLAGTSNSTRQGGRIEVISRGLLGDDYFKGDIITTEVHNDVYYILYNDRIVTMDQRYVNALQSGAERIATNFVEYDVSNVRFIEVFDDDVLYGTTTDNTVVEMFKGDNDLVMSYVSPLITLANDERIKYFGKLFVNYRQSGDLVIKARLFNQSTTPEVKTYPLESNKSVREAKLPGNSYYGIQFEVAGKGSIAAIAFIANPSDSVKPTGNVG